MTRVTGQNRIDVEKKRIAEPYVLAQLRSYLTDTELEPCWRDAGFVGMRPRPVYPFEQVIFRSIQAGDRDLCHVSIRGVCVCKAVV